MLAWHPKWRGMVRLLFFLLLTAHTHMYIFKKEWGEPQFINRRNTQLEDMNLTSIREKRKLDKENKNNGIYS